MKTKLAILFALATAGASFGTHADSLLGDVPAPGVIGLQTLVPKLYPSEQGAFKALEVAAQLLEARIVQKGCSNIAFPIEVHTFSNGSGNATISDINGGSVPLTIALDQVRAAFGRQYNVTSVGGNLNGITYGPIAAHGSFNIGSSIQELSTRFTASSDVVTTLDPFYGTIIKDYVRLYTPVPIPVGFDDVGTPVSTVVDYGYQQISKFGYVKAKYWQYSRFWREDGVNSGVWWTKTRVAPAGQSCAIEVKLQGYGQQPGDSIEGFNEKGYIAIKTVDAGPFKAE